MSDTSRLSAHLPELTRRQLIGGGLAAGGALALGAPHAVAAPARAWTTAAPRHIEYHTFRGPSGFAHGHRSGTRTGSGGLVLHHPTAQRTYTDPFAAGAQPVTYDVGTWTSPVLRNSFRLTELISSWDVDTPKGTWIEVNVRGWDESGTQTGWFILGRWARDDVQAGGAINRTSVDGQGTEIATVWTDTLHLEGAHTLNDLELRIQLMRPAGSDLTPTVRFLGAVSSALPGDPTVPVSAPGLRRAITLDVPTYSQELHQGQYPQYDNGGEAWCSPTSTSMVVAYWHRGPSRSQLSWVEPMTDPQVAYAARNTYDYTYEGCGNWPFNAAYAASFGLEGFVTRLRSLREAEAFIASGIPLVTSVSFKSSELDGAGYSTDGHLMVLVGFTKDGDVVMNDPASHLIASDDQVRTVYKREQFENVWVPRSGGTVYVIHPSGMRLPRPPREANW
ncbi:C39 family peptidase [Leekyejoonella antrihumi]|uniref:Peptidase C39 family protein n=1 Tax=Leekyejoonella antrihumi TaxID=1660198 RepID=A0A563E308_9MICO|nr:C39 family peptidase [Leekyejoonella antrihumi]TWP36920.1 peptidase C39 family protein [Leekyejoonella antrihumi]